MDYKEKYEQALARARQFSEHPSQEDSSNIVEYIFPELRESDGEKIRKELIAMVRLSCTNGDDVDKKIAWLEKQGEQKPVEWSKEDEEHIESILSTIEYCKAQYPNAQAVVEAYNADIEWLKSFKDRVQPQPKQEWSEKDEKIIQDIINDIAIAQEQVYCKSRCEDEIKWLKSLRPQSHWKPSEEQIELMGKAVCYFEECWVSKDQKVLETLYEQLKAL